MAMGPGAHVLGEGSHTPKGRPGNPHTAVLSRLLCKERARKPRPVCTTLVYCRQNTSGSHLEPRPRDPNWHFSPGEP